MSRTRNSVVYGVVGSCGCTVDLDIYVYEVVDSNKTAELNKSTLN